MCNIISQSSGLCRACIPTVAYTVAFNDIHRCSSRCVGTSIYGRKPKGAQYNILLSSLAHSLQAKLADRRLSNCNRAPAVRAPPAECSAPDNVSSGHIAKSILVGLSSSVLKQCSHAAGRFSVSGVGEVRAADGSSVKGLQA